MVDAYCNLLKLARYSNSIGGAKREAAKLPVNHTLSANKSVIR